MQASLGATLVACLEQCRVLFCIARPAFLERDPITAAGQRRLAYRQWSIVLVDANSQGAHDSTRPRRGSIYEAAGVCVEESAGGEGRCSRQHNPCRPLSSTLWYRGGLVGCGKASRLCYNRHAALLAQARLARPRERSGRPGKGPETKHGSAMHVGSRSAQQDEDGAVRCGAVQSRAMRHCLVIILCPSGNATKVRSSRVVRRGIWHNLGWKREKRACGAGSEEVMVRGNGGSWGGLGMDSETRPAIPTRLLGQEAREH